MSPTKPLRDLLGFLGLAHRAGSVIRGTEAVRTALRAGDAQLVLLASDAAPGQIAKLSGLLEHRGVSSAVLGTRADLGRALGGAALSAVALRPSSFADRLLADLTAELAAGERSGSQEEDGIHAG